MDTVIVASIAVAAFAVGVCVGLGLACLPPHETSRPSRLAEAQEQITVLKQQVQSRDNMLDVKATRFNDENCALKKRLTAALNLAARDGRLLAKVRDLVAPKNEAELVIRITDDK